ncbi:MAG: hypothetical protein KDC80_13420 [Saprospiraceae bacterium]|nr:hypothetical protein [Saprospiraceae bacterium]
MNFRHWSLLIAILCLVTISCNNAEKQALREEARSSLRDIPEGSITPPAATGNSSTANTPEPAQNAAGIWHYTCPNGCAGGAGAAGKCTSCGADLAHNTAYHQSANSQPAISQSGNDDPIVDFSNLQGTSSAPTAEPAQNAAGVWHYTCPSGCAGGAGSAGKCANCGSDLAHNTAYHSQGGSPAQPSINLNSSPTVTTPTNTPEPAQNAAGVWHYTCPNGCSGGAGSAGKCSSCGGNLAHNTAYHN